VLVGDIMARILAAFFTLTLSLVPALAAEIVPAKSKDGWTHLFILGKIELGDEVKFKNTMLRLAKNGTRVTGVNVYSPGGSVYAAIKIGSYIRAIHLFGVWLPTETLPFSFNVNMELD
jgi:hypothetical protein